MSNQQEIQPQQALATLVSASRQLKLSYDEHALLEKCAYVIEKAITPVESKTAEAPESK